MFRRPEVAFKRITKWFLRASLPTIVHFTTGLLELYWVPAHRRWSAGSTPSLLQESGSSPPLRFAWDCYSAPCLKWWWYGTGNDGLGERDHVVADGDQWVALGGEER